MADFLAKREENFRSLNMKTAHLSENGEMVDETRAITDLIWDQRLNLKKKDAAKLPTEAVTDLEPLGIPRLVLVFSQEMSPPIRNFDSQTTN